METGSTHKHTSAHSSHGYLALVSSSVSPSFVQQASANLFNVPVVELRRDLDPLRVLVHGEVEVRSAALHRYMVPMLIV